MRIEIAPVDMVVIGIGAVFFVLLIYMTIVSLLEEEKRAARRALFLAVLAPLPFLFVGIFDFAYQQLTATGLVSLTALAVIVLGIPSGSRGSAIDDTPTTTIDERDIMFARNRLVPGTERFEEYYRNNPDKKGLDDRFRAKPGMLGKGAKYFDHVTFSASAASFATIEKLRPYVEGDPAPERVDVDPEGVTGFVKSWALRIGAVSVGVTELEDYHKYSIIGRTEPYGEPVVLDHKYAMAITVEMDKHMIDRGPHGPTVMESAQQYVRSGVIAVQIAQFIRNLGYSSRAHIDGNYRVVCPLVARDAGLGEIGRMGLLMTPELGPRVRVSAVTTDLPLVPDTRRRDYTMIDFCTRCQKCADACPSKAIPFEDRKDIDGVVRWQINSEDCFTYWCVVGTDCSRCVKVCPYSHPDNPLHNFVRWGVRRSSVFRRLAIVLDDFFYGKKPAPAGLADWMNVKATVATNAVKRTRSSR